MWIHDLGNFYEKEVISEGYRGLSVDRKLTARGVQSPTESKPNLSIRNNKMGTQTPTMAASSKAGNVQFGNPYEQEEMVGKEINKSDVMEKINNILNSLDEDSPADRVALLEITKLRDEIEKL